MLGQTIAHYRILRQLGSGGMGVVYEAEDLRLSRRVALKFLSDATAGDAVERFQREARTASALNHPHICTIYDIGEHQGSPYLVMELLAGDTLRGRLLGHPLPPAEILDIAVQVAEALQAAHDKGIIHRDIKPGNIFLAQPCDHVKILDFGLAKRSDEPAALADSLQPTASLRREPLTNPGTALGTVAYMSPEQARGERLDPRTDLFSLGVVLYEMAAGLRPFQGNTTALLFESLLHRDPDPPTRLSPALPAELERIILKALEKDRAVRYQTASDLLADLKRFRRDSETVRTAAVQPPRRSRYAFAAALLAAVALAAAWAMLRARRPPPPRSLAWEQLTDFSDSVVAPALSPDGRMLAFIRGQDTFAGLGEIYLKLLPSGDPVPLTHDGASKMSPVFSPDGSRIAYTTVGPKFAWNTWVVPLIGGQPQQLLPNASGLTWVDGSHVLFSEIRTGAHMGLVTSDEARGGARDVYWPPRERGMAHRSYRSPDGKWVLLAEMDNDGWLPCRLLPFDGSSSGRQVGPPDAACTYAAWSPDGKWMYLDSAAGGSFHIWRQPLSGGAPEQITSGPTEEAGIAVAPDGRSLVTSVGAVDSEIWLHGPAGERQLSSEAYACCARFSADGATLYYLAGAQSAHGWEGAGTLWAVTLGDGHRQQVLPGIRLLYYDISRDGQRVVYAALDAQGHPQIWLASLDRRFSPRLLPVGPADSPVFGAPGEIYFRAGEGPLNYVFAVREDGTGKRKLRPEPILELHDCSPDGHWFLAWSRVPGDDVTNALLAFPVSEFPPVQVSVQRTIHWSPDGRLLYIGLTRRSGLMTTPGVFVVPVSPEHPFAAVPSGGFDSDASIARIRGARKIDAQDLTPGPTPSIYAFRRLAAHRNLYRIPLP